TGFDVSMDDLKQFRQLGSRTPGHPEYGHTPGVETTTGPLGQGFSNAVGMAIAEAHLAATFNKPDYKIVDHYTYVFCSDGDLEEGISHEGASLAGNLRLSKLIYFYDDNHISIEGDTSVTFTDDTGKRFEAYGWHVQYADGHDLEQIEQAIVAAQAVTDRPHMIICRTHIGYGSPKTQDTGDAHGKPLGADEVIATKHAYGYPSDEPFYVAPEALTKWRKMLNRGEQLQGDWRKQLDAYTATYPDEAAEYKRRLTGELPEGWADNLPTFEPGGKDIATRSTSGQVINALAKTLPGLVGGSADLAGSNDTWMKDFPAFEHANYAGRNFHFGVREHNMAGVLNGMATHGGIRPFGATFLIFYDYMRPAVRLAALSRINPIFVYTHDSIAQGEDGPTHSPVEQMLGLRAVPNLLDIRPADGNETAAAWKVAIEQQDRPTAMAFTRQPIPTLQGTKEKAMDGLPHGAYILSDCDGTPDIILMASGSEVSLILEAQPKLAEQGIKARVVSFPSWRLFREQSQEYRDSVLLPTVTTRLAVEAASPIGWERWVGEKGGVIGVDRFGASAPVKQVMPAYGFTVENVVETALKLLGKGRDVGDQPQQPTATTSGDNPGRAPSGSEGHS
ncbi:MAG: transketolase, partial [Candidatus Chloroheliales bacterium]